jgi:hypothetical protein
MACTVGGNVPAQLGLAGNMLTGDIPVSLENKTCISQLAVQRAISVCPAGSAEAGRVAGGDSSTWQRAACAPCPDGEFSSAPGALACTPCEPGYYSLPSGTTCAPCDAGFFLNATSAATAAQCTPCPPGTYAQRGALACAACQANTYAAGDAAACLSCPDASTSSAGAASLASCACATGSVAQYAADNASFNCLPCAAGSYHDAAADVCRPCEAGSYSGVAGAASCTPVDAGFVASADGTGQAPCAAGTFLDAASRSCAACQPGTFSASSGALACALCPPGTIAAAQGASACDECPASSRDSDAHTTCACVAGFFDTALGANSTAPACSPCPDGGVCAGGVLLAQEGWWRESPTDAVFLKCREGFCQAEDAAAPAAMRLAQQATGHCAAGHGGTLCAVCLDGYTMQGGFCSPCDAADAWAAWSPASRGVTIALFVPAGMLLLTLLLFLPLLPAAERVLWRSTAATAAAAEAAVGAMGALRRCGHRAEDARIARRSSMRTSVSGSQRLSTATQSDGAAEAADTAGAGSMDELLEAAAALLTALARPGKILIK